MFSKSTQINFGRIGSAQMKATEGLESVCKIRQDVLVRIVMMFK